ncbi:hypothetical protein B0I35DRAFT_477344 [Stachybotrys elegans]|uniref:Uncharacterized protein n=1 Tax=Stachybotrys elegans TaxID=80388 RepID=A0A8K0WRU9_9HYPO|nr:hypothetical protein B0I35DRAFT_477344 [Stachybotrys elegans]
MMMGPSCWLCAALLALRFVHAAEFRHLDGVHRVEKRAQITAPAVLLARQDDGGADFCGTDSSLTACPASLNGGCCPQGYDCARESCYATTRGVSTCHGRVGWYGCDAQFGGGCCPEGYRCDRNDNCLPPDGEPYTLSCPANKYLCPASLSYGCCPEGMACGLNQCYSTQATTITTTILVTTTDDGTTRTLTSLATQVSTPEAPTRLPTNSDEDDQILKFFPTAIPKETPAPQNDDDDGDDGGLSTGQLAGIVTGAVVFLIIILVTAYIIIRHLNNVVRLAAGGGNNSQRSGTAQTRTTIKQFDAADSEIDGKSINPLMYLTSRGHRARARRYNGGGSDITRSDVSSSARPTPSSFNGAYQSVSMGSPRQGSFDMAGNLVDGYFPRVNAASPPMTQVNNNSSSNNNNNNNVGAPSVGRPSSESQATYAHGRQISNASESSNDAGGMSARILELEAHPYVPELDDPSSEPMISPLESTRLSTYGIMSRPPPTHQHSRSDSRGVRPEMSGNLAAVAEEPMRAHASRIAEAKESDEAVESPIVYSHPSFKR